MNQVEFLGLAQTFVTVSPSNILRQTLSRDTQIFTVVREVVRNNYQSRNLIGPYHFGE